VGRGGQPGRAGGPPGRRCGAGPLATRRCLAGAGSTAAAVEPAGCAACGVMASLGRIDAAGTTRRSVATASGWQWIAAGQRRACWRVWAHRRPGTLAVRGQRRRPADAHAQRERAATRRATRR
jgi:hypothetical protein